MAFALTNADLRKRTITVRWALLCAFAFLAIPSVLFAVYYVHILPEQAWFYTLRSWRGTELLVVFLGCAGGAVASLLPRVLLVLPLFGSVVLAIVPFAKPLLGPIADSDFTEHWNGDVCMQSTASTCGPASVCTILKMFGVVPSERVTARAAFSYSGGTEAWYLARYVRSMGCVVRFDLRETFSRSAGLPAVVGVRLGGAGHFIAVLNVTGDQVTFADPLIGKDRMAISQFQKRYDFTGFHMVITKP